MRLLADNRQRAANTECRKVKRQHRDTEVDTPSKTFKGLLLPDIHRHNRTASRPHRKLAAIRLQMLTIPPPRRHPVCRLPE
jgi:hypothetical protein